MKTLALLLLVMGLLLSGCASAEQQQVMLDSRRATGTADVAQATATHQAWEAQRSATVQALDVAIISGHLAQTQVAGEVQATEAAAQMWAAQTQTAERATDQARADGRATAAAQGTQAAQRATEAAEATATAFEMGLVQATMVQAAALDRATEGAAGATAQAQGTQGANEQAIVELQRTQQALVVAQQQAEATLDATRQALALERQAQVNQVRAWAPLIVMAPFLMFIGWLIYMLVDARRKQEHVVRDGEGEIAWTFNPDGAGVLLPNVADRPVLDARTPATAGQLELARLARGADLLREALRRGALEPEQMRRLTQGEGESKPAAVENYVILRAGEVPAQVADQETLRVIDAQWKEAGNEYE